MRRTQIYITDKQYDELRKISFETGLTISQLIRDFIDEYFINASKLKNRRLNLHTIRQMAKLSIAQIRDLRRSGFIE